MASLRKRTHKTIKGIRKSLVERKGKLGVTCLWDIEFSEDQYTRKSLSLGRMPESQAREFFMYFEDLERSRQLACTPRPDTVQWLERIDGRLFDKLSSLGFVTFTVNRSAKNQEFLLGPFTRQYIDTMSDAAERTKNNYEQTRSWLIKHFGEDKPLSAITAEDMKRWQRTLKASESLNSVSNRNKHLQRAKTFFRAAVNDRIISESPASVLKQESLPGGRRIDRTRQFFVDGKLSARVLAGLESNQWKLIFCLLRIQGFRRCEVFSLTWEHVDWDLGILKVHSRKTGYRECPIFADTAKYLNAAFERAVEMADQRGKTLDKSKPVVVWESSEAGMTTMLRRRVERVLGEGKGWPKICHQLRSSRRTELEEEFPAHVCNEWLGHDDSTAEKHYKQVTPEHWEQAKKSRIMPVLDPKVPQNARSQASSEGVRKPRKHQKTQGNVAFPGFGGEEQAPRRGVLTDSVRPEENSQNSEADESKARNMPVCSKFAVVLLSESGRVSEAVSRSLSLKDASDLLLSGGLPGMPAIVIDSDANKLNGLQEHGEICQMDD